jgi:peptidoglycan/xylan/chitin deacetylase (PgdA/CDA1 family)
MQYKPKYYAYPYGEFNNNIENELKKFDFDMILNQNSGSINTKSNPYSINRVALVGKVDIVKKLKYKTLDAQWIEPKEFPKDGILKFIKAKVSKDIKNIKLYITGEGWVNLKVKDGIIAYKLNAKLKNSRTRVVLSTDYYNIATKIIIKTKDPHGK